MSWQASDLEQPSKDKSKKTVICMVVCIGLGFACLNMSAASVANSRVAKSNLGTGSFTAQSIVFKNFDEPVELLKQSRKSSLFRGQTDQIQPYRVKGTGQDVVLCNRLIVKTSTAISKKQLYLYHSQIIKVTELFLGVGSHYYLLEIKNHELLASVLMQLKDKPHVELVQPDILQLRNKSERLDEPRPSMLHPSNTRVLASGFLGAADESPNTIPAQSISKATGNPYLAVLNVQSLWEKTKGKGVKIAIIDDGINLQHPDLQHITPSFSYDAEQRKLSSSPLSNIDRHGTMVAGIIFAAHNGFGIDGIAPEAELIALRQPDTWTSNTLLSFQLAKLAGADIVNCSWHSRWLLQPVADIVNELAATGRGGKGLPIVFSAGNENRLVEKNMTESAIMSAIVVGAGDGGKRRLGYSNYGPSVDLYIYATPVMSTGRDGGYQRFSGTSLAAAITSGYVALLLAQNSELTLGQVVAKLRNRK